MAYHISNDGQARPCRAKPGNCRLQQGDAPHYETKQEAEAAALASISDPKVHDQRNRSNKPLTGLSEGLKETMQNTLAKEGLAYFKEHWAYNTKTVQDSTVEKVRKDIRVLVDTIDEFVRKHPYPSLDGERGWQNEYTTKEEADWMGDLARACGDKLDYDARQSHGGLTDLMGLPPVYSFGRVGSIRRTIFRFGIGGAGVDKRQNIISDDYYDKGDKAERWQNLLARTAIRTGTPVSYDASIYSWSDYSAAKHLKECEVTHVSRVEEHDSWSEFAGTFASSDDYKHGIRLSGCHCRCRRWVGDIRLENDGMKRSLHDILETAGLL